MTETFETNTTEFNQQILIDTFFKVFPHYADSSASITEEKSAEQTIRSAWTYLVNKTQDIKRSSGVPYYLHPMRVACIIAKAELDTETIVSGLLHSILEVSPDSSEEIKSLYGEAVANICTQTAKITGMHINSKTMQQADSIRKMLFAMVDDIRVILVKLADRLDRMRNLKFVSEESQKAVAKEVIDIWAPLANRLGMADVKSELEDLSLKYTNPDVFQQIKTIVAQKKDERSGYLENAVKKIYSSAEKAGISVTITSRAKHFYSIYQKMRKRNKEAGELYDLLALRIICSTETECYTLIGIVHGLWKPMDGRFKDYIAMPKANGYQSLHTTVICEGKPLEIQIRTQKMHDVAEHGVASHWLYKKGTSHDMVDASSIGIINQLKELRNQHLTDEAFFAELKSDLLGDEIFVFTPRGDVIQLPSGSCAIDFAYAIHSAIGEKIVGAKADGKIIPLTVPLKNTQIIEVMTNPQAHPTQNQLKVVKTSKAHQKIHAWLVENDETFIDKDAAAKREAEILANSKHSREVAEQKALKRRPSDGPKAPAEDDKFSGKIKIGDTTNFFITIAKCCNPKQGDAIAGYVSRCRGITIHKASCLTFQRIRDVEKRTIEVEWDLKDPQKK